MSRQIIIMQLDIVVHGFSVQTVTHVQLDIVVHGFSVQTVTHQIDHSIVCAEWHVSCTQWYCIVLLYCQ